MVGGKLVFLLQAMGRIPGLGFMDVYANEILQKSLKMRSHKERALELKDRGKEVGQAGRDVTGTGGKDKKGGGGKSGPGGKRGSGGRGGGGGGGGPQGRGPQGRGPQGRGPNRGGSDDGWGNIETDRGGLRRSPPSNTDRLRGPDDPEPGPDRLRRKNYDL